MTTRAAERILHTKAVDEAVTEKADEKDGSQPGGKGQAVLTGGQCKQDGSKCQPEVLTDWGQQVDTEEVC